MVVKEPVLWRTALQAEDRIEDHPGTPSPSVYQVTHGTALQAAERYVMQRVLRDSIRGLPHARQNGLFLFIALARMVAFIIMKVMVCFWFGR